jgi:hypothetical protein
VARFNFTQCRRVLLQGVLDALRYKARAIKAIDKDDSITGVALDLAPWHGGVGLALRIRDDPRDDYKRYSSVEWRNFTFVSKEHCKALVPVGEYIRTAYDAKGEGGQRDMAHLIFLAGAEAMLDRKVATYLQSLKLDAPVVRDRLDRSYFEYIVVDPDGTIPGNYCNVVKAMRVTKRLLKTS